MNISMIGNDISIHGSQVTVNANNYMRLKKRRALSGFTFMEMIVVISLFSVLMVATSDIFMRAQRTQRKTAALQRLQDDARYLTQKVTSELQAGSIDFGAYSNAKNCSGSVESEIDPVQGNALLALQRFDGTRLFIQQSNRACVDDDSTPCLAVSDDGITWSSASSKGVKIESLTFYISPDKDPFTYCDDTGTYLRDTQPRVTVSLTASVAVKSVSEPVRLSVQTTIASREYKR